MAWYFLPQLTGNPNNGLTIKHKFLFRKKPMFLLVLKLMLLFRIKSVLNRKHQMDTTWDFSRFGKTRNIAKSKRVHQQVVTRRKQFN